MGRSQMTATALLGAWVAVTACMWLAATGSFATVNRVLGRPSPGFSEASRPLGQDQSRLVLRHLASEINRTYFGAYGWAQIVLGALLLALLVRQTPRDAGALGIVGAMLGVVLVLAFVITPQIVTLGRTLDFVPRDPPPPELARFGRLHGLYTVLDGAKLLAGFGLLVRWLVAR